MQTAILVLHILICVFLVILVLLQAGREGMGVIFGGGGNNSVFGSQGAGGILTKLTAFLAVLFVITSLTYNIMFSSQFEGSKSILDVQFEEAIPNNENQPESEQPKEEPVSLPDATENSEQKAIPSPSTETENTASENNTTSLPAEHSETPAQNDEVSAENSEAQTENNEVQTENSEVQTENSEVQTENNEVSNENSETPAQNNEVPAENNETQTENSEVQTENSETNN